MNRSILALTLLLAWEAFAETKHPEKPEPIKSTTLRRVLNHLSSEKITDVDTAIPTLVEEYGPGFTATRKSGGTQGLDRALLFGYSGETITGLGGDATNLEMTDSVDSVDGMVPYTVSFGKDEKGHSKVTALSNPAQCVACHTEKFVPIFREYQEEWSGFLGANDDKQDPLDPDYIALNQHSRFSPFFQYSRKMPGMAGRKAAPYYAEGEPQQLIAAPNTHFTHLAGTRAGRSAWNRIRFSNPARYKAVRLLLVAANNCLDAKYPTPLKRPHVTDEVIDPVAKEEWNQIWAKFEKQFEAKTPGDAKKWQKIVEEGNKVNTQFSGVPVLKVLNYLGLQPHQIILTQPWNGKNPLDSFENYKALMKTYRGYTSELKDEQGKDELHLPSPAGFHTDVNTPGMTIASLIMEEIKGDYPEFEFGSYLRGMYKAFEDAGAGPDAKNLPTFKGSRKYVEAADSIAKMIGKYGGNPDPAYCTDLRKHLLKASFEEPEVSSTQPIPKESHAPRS